MFNETGLIFCISSDQPQVNVAGVGGAPSVQVHISVPEPPAAPTQVVPPGASQEKVVPVQVGVPLLVQVIVFEPSQDSVYTAAQVNVSGLPSLQVQAFPVVAPTQSVPPGASQEKVVPVQVGVPLLVQVIAFEPSQDSV